MSRWLQTDDGDWCNLAFAIRVRFERETDATIVPKATIWFLDGGTSTAHGDLSFLRAEVCGEPTKDNLISAYRAR